MVQYQINELQEKIKDWAVARNLQTGEPKGQVYKLLEEFGELTSGLAKVKEDVIIDSIGDIFVVLNVLSTQLDIKTKEINKAEDLPKGIETYDVIVNLTNSFGLIANSIQVYDKENKQNSSVEILEKNIYNCYLLLEILCDTLGLDLTYCVSQAYEEIKDRKGRLVDGIFIKESDL